jgi:hypothetical protein
MPLIGVKSQRERRADEIFPRSLLLGRNHFPQFLNSSLKSALFALVILVPLRQTGHLALESSPPDLHRNLASSTRNRNGDVTPMTRIAACPLHPVGTWHINSHYER